MTEKSEMKEPTNLPENVSPGAGARRVMTERESRRIIWATFLGTTVEWYDFYIYAACAALVFGPQFFPGGDPVAGQIGAFATFAFGFVSRPLGGMLAGHFGDRLGRKRMLVLSLLIMGVATTLVGLLPTYEQIGITAPILLTVLRLMQGLGVGAEWGGAVTMAIEHAPPKRKALYGAAPIIGLPAGLLLSNLMLITLGVLTGPNFTTWGWRIAFVFSFALVIIGLWVRHGVSESPEFQSDANRQPKTYPFLSVLRHYTVPLICTISIAGVPAIPSYLVLTWALSYGTTNLGYERNELLLIGIICCLAQMIAIPLLALRVDKGNPRTLAVVGAGIMALTMLAFFPLFETGNIFLAGLATLLVHGSTYLPWALVSPMLGRAFPSAVRYTGVSMAYQFGAILGGGFAPMIATALLASSGATWPVALYVVGACAVMLLGVVGLSVYYRIRGNEPDWD
jgi:predicted MFS family arabinose efflux permease